jgi:hypothetical protein
VLVAALLVVVSPARGGSQALPFAVPIVDWERQAFDRQRSEFRSERAFHSEGYGREMLVCVEAWTTAAPENGVERITITRVRRVRAGESNSIANVQSHCVGEDGERLPMIHTHSDGNCQFSPSDLISVAARGASFDGVQCGERHFVWVFAWQIMAISTFVEQERRTQARVPPP